VCASGAAPVGTWTNLAVGDSAGRPVHRWISRGVQLGPEGAGSSWELVQTYDARTLAPLTYYRWASNGAYTRLRIEGTRVRGVQQVPGEAAPAPSTGPSRRRGRVEGHGARGADGALVATWYLTDSSPFMVLGDMPLPNGGTQRITGEALDHPRPD
jgi:hypothetical protein